jgi:putative flippase GtrA
VVDLGLFFLLSLFMPSIVGLASDAVCTLIARIGSSMVNYSINKKAVFRSSGSGRTSLIRYYILAAGIFILSASAMTVLPLLFGFDKGRFAFLKTVIKFIIDSILFLISFRVQREWVFADAENT